jgi:hypothetical protein
MNESLILCSTFHDPELRLRDLIIKALPSIRKLFPTKIIACTEVTAKKLEAALPKNEFIIIGTASSKVVDTYALGFRTALRNLEKENEKVFYVDFDRLVHWILEYPEELENILRKNQEFDYLHIGRSERAFESHPETQKNTEKIINNIGSETLGFENPKDLISVCFIFNKTLCHRILSLENKTSTGFYGTWPLIFWNEALTKTYIEVEGLEWETPDRFISEIKEIGYSNWLKNFQSSSEWRKRVRFINDFITELKDLIKIKLL